MLTQPVSSVSEESGPTVRITDDRVPGLGAQVAEAARQITQTLGGVQ